MTMLEKQINAATVNVEKAEKGIVRAQKKFDKMYQAAVKLDCVWEHKDWWERRESGNYTKDQDWASFEYRCAKEDLQEQIERLAKAEKALNKLLTVQDIKGQEHKRIESYAIPAIDQFLDNWERSVMEYYQEKGELDEAKIRDIKWDKWFKKASIIHKVEKHVGKIVDTGNLHIGSDGNINGRIIGDKDSCYVQTIIAGGWNIQCLHYRVMINK